MSQLKEEMTVSYQQECPKKKGSKSFDRYEKYKVAKTVGEATRLGASKSDFECDVGKGFCKVTDAQGNPVELPSAKQAPVDKAAKDKPAPVDKAAKDESSFHVNVTLPKPDGASLGVECFKICDANGSESLVIGHIRPDAFHAWNQQCANGQPGHTVRKGDRIVSVNAVSTSRTKEEIENNQLLNFTLVRGKSIAEDGKASPTKKREASLPEPNAPKKQKTSASASSHERHVLVPVSKIEGLEWQISKVREIAATALRRGREIDDEAMMEISSDEESCVAHDESHES